MIEFSDMRGDREYCRKVREEAIRRSRLDGDHRQADAMECRLAALEDYERRAVSADEINVDALEISELLKECE